MKILGTGLQGLIGSRIVALLSSRYTFENISRTTGVDITNNTEVNNAIEQSDADVVLHLAAKTNVDGCEADKKLGKEGEAWKINVEGTRHIATACETFGKKLIYISTDFVFDGEKEFYQEEDIPNPINWYAVTKYEGEKIVAQTRVPWVIMRIAYPYRGLFVKKDFVRAIKEYLEKGQRVTMVTDHIMTPTYVDNFISALDILLQKKMTGIYHTVGSEFLSPFEAACSIADTFGYSKDLIQPTTRAVFFENRAPRPFRLALKNDKIRKLDIQMDTFKQGLQKLKEEL